MSKIEPTIQSAIRDDFIRYYRHLATRVDRAARSIPVDKLWTNPYPYGNSIGHLVLHLTGNLNHYIGAGIAKSGYLRDRPREFSETNPPDPETLLANFHKAVEMVVETINHLDDQSWTATITDNPPIETNFGLVLVCAAHLNNHIGQLAYLVQALGHSTNEPPIW
jgi:uncharacterized damage-inducible protein DinB